MDGQIDDATATGSIRPARMTPPVLALVAANLVPLYGVLFLGWEVFQVVLLFWMENVVVGVFFILRLLTARPEGVLPGSVPGGAAKAVSVASVVPLPLNRD